MATRGILATRINIEKQGQERRRQTRYSVPKQLRVGWQGGGKRDVSRVETLSMGGVFLCTAHPLSSGTILELLFDAPSGEVRARGVVRHALPGKGMGVKFVQMQADDRARLNRFIQNLEAQSNTGTAAPRTAQQPSAPIAPPPETPRTEKSESRQEFEEEMRKLLEVSRKATYYELLGVTAASTPAQVKQHFQRLARKFHPDRHMGRSEWNGLLQELMGHLTAAYKTLGDEEKRARYDKQLASAGAFTLGHHKTEKQETLDECLARAKEHLRAHDFAGSIFWLRKCVEIAPDGAEYHAMLARSLATVPQYRQEAIAHFEKAIELDLWNTSAYLQLAELYEVMRLPWRAVPLYRKILHIDPTNECSAQLRKLERKSLKAEEKSFVSQLFRKH
jgi:curved DNA-binding protein CbpA